MDNSLSVRVLTKSENVKTNAKPVKWNGWQQTENYKGNIIH